MASEEWHKMHSAQITGGSYSVNSFFIRANSFADLDPDDSETLPYAVHIHAHEYVHFLHNVSTVSGLYLFVAGLYLMGNLVACTDSNGQSLGDDALSDDQRTWLKSLVAWLVALKGGEVWANANKPDAPPVKWFFEVPVRKAFQLQTPTQMIDVGVGTVCGTAIDADGNVFPFSIDIGYDLITEGIAYEVDREIRRENGVPEWDLDRFTPAYPYLAYGALVDSLLGRVASAKERIQIGVAALQSSSPSAGFVDCCAHFKLHGPVSTDGKVLTPVISEAVANNLIEKTLVPVLKALRGDCPAAWGGFDALELFKAGFKLRVGWGLLEFSFLDRPMGKSDYRGCIAAMMDCCVIQAKPDGKVIHEWVGPGTVARTEDDASRIGVFQASLHYTLMHVGPSGRLHPTAALRPYACPYSGGCQVELDDGMPEECRVRPWARFKDEPPGAKACWYAAGVKALARRVAED